MKSLYKWIGLMHPDKVCDRIRDLDAVLEQDKNGRVAVETAIKMIRFIS